MIVAISREGASPKIANVPAEPGKTLIDEVPAKVFARLGWMPKTVKPGKDGHFFAYMK